MAWLKVSQSLPTHRKTLALADALGVHPMQAVGHMIALWTWALDNAPRGLLECNGPRMIACAAQWTGDPSVFVAALCDVRFLDERVRNGQRTYIIHDWDEYGGRLAERREKDADRKRTVRAASSGHPTDILSLSDSQEQSRVEHKKKEREPRARGKARETPLEATIGAWRTACRAVALPYTVTARDGRAVRDLLARPDAPTLDEFPDAMRAALDEKFYRSGPGTLATFCEQINRYRRAPADPPPPEYPFLPVPAVLP